MAADAPITNLPVVAMLDVFTTPDVEQEVLKGVATVECYHAANSSEIPDRVQKSPNILKKMSNAKVLVRAGVGYDNVDIGAAAAMGLPVCVVPDYGTEEVADATMGLLLAAARKICVLAQEVKEGKWPTLSAAGSKRLRDKQLGIIGLGRIGKAVALRAKAFGMHVVFYDPYLEDGIDKALGIQRVDELHALMRTSDFISLNCLLNAETRHLLGHAALAVVKPGGLVDTEALLASLRDGRLTGAALDVLEDEPTKPDQGIRAEIRALPNVIVTPHTAFYSDESILELRTKTALEVRRVLEGKKPRNCVNLHLLPQPKGPAA